MTSRTAIRWARNPILAAVLLVAFCSRALVPTGYMPGHGGLVICSGYVRAQSAAAARDMSAMDMAGMADTADMDMSARAVPYQAGHRSEDGGAPKHDGVGLCPFAAAATSMATGQSVAFVLVAVRAVTARIQFPPDRIIPRGTIVPTRLPRGPPALV